MDGAYIEWIAYYELLEYLSGNLYFDDRGYEDVDDSKFWGPWQIDVREMDPTYWFKAKKDVCYDDKVYRWWRPYHFKFESEDLVEQKNGYGMKQHCRISRRLFAQPNRKQGPNGKLRDALNMTTTAKLVLKKC